MKACYKRQRVEDGVCIKTVVSDNNAACGRDTCPICMDCSLLALPREVLLQVLGCLDAISLLAVSQTCKTFRVFDSSTGLRLVESIAKSQTLAAVKEDANRWRRRNWLGRLYIEDCAVGFEKFNWSSSNSPPPANGVPPQYRFLPSSTPGSFLNIKLEGMGPKLLVSDLSTADQPVLRWRLIVRGNTAVEFGVVPLSMVDDDKALHKCHQEEKKFEKLKGPLVDEQRPTGFCSSITVGSMLPFKTAIMKGSVVEMLARRGRLEILVQNPPDGQELYWHNTRTVPKPYKGPKEVRFEQDFAPNHDIKLALTSWAHGAFDVLHPAPGTRLKPGLQQAWDQAEQLRSRNMLAHTRKRSRPMQDDVLLMQQPDSDEELDIQQQQQQQALVVQSEIAAEAAAQRDALDCILQQQAQQQLAAQQPGQQQPHQQQGAGTSADATAVAATPAAAAILPPSPPSEESAASRDGQLLS